MNINDKLTSLRNLMDFNDLKGIVINCTDPHLSEYVTPHWRTIEWISGFTGSYGKVVITKSRAVLWTDSRYFIQAELQLKGTEYQIIKDRLPESITLEQWLVSELIPGDKLAIDGKTFTATESNVLKQKLGANGISLIENQDLLSIIWENRPRQLSTPVVDYPVRFAGQTRVEKLSAIRTKLRDFSVNATLICQLDDLAWCFNLRGNEGSLNPVFTGFGYIDEENAYLFVGKERLSPTLIGNLRKDKIEVMDYGSLLKQIEKNSPKSVYLDPNRTNSIIYSYFRENCWVVEGVAIPTLLKSIKNKVEISGMKASHRRDGAAMVNFLYWFYTRSQSEIITELSLAEKLRQFRSEQGFFKGESFNSIVGFGSNGAIVHYIATPETDRQIFSNGILLIDSGAHYLDGTTDITRTISTGKVESIAKNDYTLVLKGMIKLANAKFPKGTKGHSLDILARNDLWNNYLNYGHGTGHGVGHYLSVHEGPMSIRQEINDQPIRNGQIISDEPGLYREGKYGIRIENILLCRQDKESSFGQFLSFETLTLCPLDRRMINTKLLNKDEIRWVNNYHKKISNSLKPLLKSDVLKWLSNQCAPI